MPHYRCGMFRRSIRLLLVLALFAGALSGCVNPEKKKKADAAQQKKDEKKKDEEKKKPKIPDMSGDMQFSSFLSRLRTAVGRHDRAMLSQMMTPDFGYRWDPGMPEETCFDYWDQHGSWPELERVLHQPFKPSDVYMVAPPEFLSDRTYTGYRAGMMLVNGGWRFAYFINGQDTVPALP